MIITEEMKQLKGLELQLYCMFDHPDRESRSLLYLLYYAIVYNTNKFEEYIDKLIKYPSKQLITYYPAIDNPEKIKGKELVGSILDGAMYFG